MSSPTPDDPALMLVHRGWDHLRRHRPLAAWACWRQALAIDPDHKAANKAIQVLETSAELPVAARREYKLLPPGSESDRLRWDERLQGPGLDDLNRAADVFGRIAEESTDDSAARYNQALCLAWTGRNVEAVAALDRLLQHLGRSSNPDHHDSAVLAWALAEVLRQGGGAESLADGLTHTAFTSWGDDLGDPAAFLDRIPGVRPVPPPVDPVTGQPQLTDAAIYEWLDGPLDGDQPRRLLALVMRSPRGLRVSSPEPIGLNRVIDDVARRLPPAVPPPRREATPLPLAFLDADVWAARLPAGLDPDQQATAHRAVVEHYYENLWIHHRRKGLDGRSPLDAARAAASGDRVAGLKLRGVLLLREQLGERPSTAVLYQGYPFDRLRRRLGIEPRDPETVDPADASCMSVEDLDRLEPAGLDLPTLVNAFESAAALGDDARATRFAAALVERGAEALGAVDRLAVFATLVRQALKNDGVELALNRITQAIEADRELGQGAGSRMYRTWRAEVLARNDRGAEAAEVYDGLLAERPDPALALDAAETFLDNQEDELARRFSEVARSLAREAGDEDLLLKAEALLETI